MPCNCCEITNNVFDEKTALGDMKEYRKHGPAKHTKMILDAVRSLNLHDVNLLDIGGGIGSIYHELLGNVAGHAVHVDASAAYLKAAKEEAERRGRLEQIEFIHSDFTDVAEAVAEADVVTLDRVVCCYPDFRNLLTQAAKHGRKAVALTYPRETWYMRIGLGLANFFQKISKDPFRIFLHPITEIDSLLVSQGFKKVGGERLIIWEMAVYQRVEG